MWVLCKCTHTYAHSTHSHTDGVPQAASVASLWGFWEHTLAGAARLQARSRAARPASRAAVETAQALGPGWPEACRSGMGGHQALGLSSQGSPRGCSTPGAHCPRGLGSTLTLNPHSGRGVQELPPCQPEALREQLSRLFRSVCWNASLKLP